MKLATKLVMFYLGMVLLLPIALPTMVLAVFCCCCCGEDAPGPLEFVRRNYIHCGIWPFLLAGAVLGVLQCSALALLCCPCVCCCCHIIASLESAEARARAMMVTMIGFAWLSLWPWALAGKHQAGATR